MFRMLLELVGNASYSHACIQARNAEIALTQHYHMLNSMNGRRFKCGPHKWTVYAKAIKSLDREGALLHAKLVSSEDRIQWP